MRVQAEIEFISVLDGEGRRIHSRQPANAESPDAAFGRLITPAEERFLRCHFAIPRLGDSHAIEIAGAVVTPRIVTLQQLRLMPPLTRTVLTECAGNGRAMIEPPVSGEQWAHRALSTAQWTGVALRSLIELRDDAVEVVFTGADGGGYQRSLPREVAMDADTLIAWEMNAEPIPARFGGPLRLVVPGWYGMASVKWLARIEAVQRPFEGEFQTEKYVYAPGDPVTRLRVKSMFTGLEERVRARTRLLLSGLAWSAGSIARVDVEIDRRRHPARLVGPVLPHAWRRFELRWTPPAPGRYLLACRATDVQGNTQPDEPEWNALGYGNNAVQRVQITAL